MRCRSSHEQVLESVDGMVGNYEFEVVEKRKELQVCWLMLVVPIDAGYLRDKAAHEPCISCGASLTGAKR